MIIKRIIPLFLMLLFLTGCADYTAADSTPHATQSSAATASGKPANNVQAQLPSDKDAGSEFDFNEVPAYSGDAYTSIHKNTPFFLPEELSSSSFESYSELDTLGRCGVAYANVCLETMPTEERRAIGMIKPSGWHTIRYDCVDGKYLYNRCHLIGYQLSAENANVNNLITGTWYLNTEGMLPFEDMVANYVQKTEHHVAYRVTPVFEGDDLLARGVLMEGWSVEDQGEGICFCVFAYNVQPGIEIDYATGDSRLVAEDTEPGPVPGNELPMANEVTYIVNANWKMLFSTRMKCRFSLDSIPVYTVLISVPLVGLTPIKS